ncbi:MAG: MFS transporter [Candidatus Thalassarchaeaceae archaeon]|nr:MFS transporter [Candidatus Thalassarchaeaceae archaeon]MDP7446267.1 MFS transporter [Candidatus Thalassarchaeaceae archaeon]MDP7649145.1 MFS transporter [Candidatus Thalassarchaeaceae archaeon]HJL54690.1 MFS transporter [Candidatus Thalassarchaeaceae archaeon]HJM76726.1 MFS transporter [Candidatus Thalassarchaeaceae archaeon]
MSLSLVITLLNNVTVNVALPELAKDLDADNTELQWIMDAYVVVFGGMLLVMGAVGDRFGRKPALMVGLSLVGLVSAMTAQYATTSEHVIGARALMGLGAAMVMPATLSIIVVVFPPEERGKAVGVWVGMAGIGAPIGLLVGGWVVENFDWRAVFWINPPIIALAMTLALLMVPNSRDERGNPMDPIGATLSVAALGSILYAIIEGPSAGWTSNEVAGLGALGLVLTMMFVWWERRTEYPMLPIEFFRDKGFTLGLIAISLAFFVMFSFMFTQMLHFQLVRGHSSFQAALRFLPLPLGLMPAAANSDRLCARFGSNNVVAVGLTLIATAMLIFTTVEIGTDYTVLFLIFFLCGLGMGLTMAPSTTMVMDSIPPDKAGVGSATNDASREVGGAFGIAIVGSALNEIYQRELVVPEGLEEHSSVVSESFPAAMRIGHDLLEGGNMLGLELIENARLAFMDGMTGAAVAPALVALVNAVLVKMYMPRRAIHIGSVGEE